MRLRFMRILGMVVKEFQEIARDSRILRVIFVAPVVQLLAFGYAVSTDIQDTTTFVVDHDRSQVSREIVDAMTATGYFEVVGYSEYSGDLDRALDNGTAVVGIEIPVGFAAGLQEGRPVTAQVLLDGTNSNTAMIARGYAERIIQDYVSRLASGPRLPGIDLRERAWFNPDLASRNYNVPAVVGSLILLICLLLTSLAVVREREIGTLDQLRVSPLTPGELIAGKTIPFGLVGLVDLSLVTLVAVLWFEIPFRGSIFMLFFASSLYILSALGIGLLISTVSSTLQEAFMSSFLVFMPSLLLSGFMFPVSSMPDVFQWITYANPVRHYIEIVRAIFLKGAGLETFWLQYLLLAIIGSSLLGIATWRFKRANT